MVREKSKHAVQWDGKKLWVITRWFLLLLSISFYWGCAATHANYYSLATSPANGEIVYHKLSSKNKSHWGQDVYRLSPLDNKTSDTIFFNCNIHYSSTTVYYWPFTKVSDSQVFYSRKLFNPWIGMTEHIDGWCPMKSLSSNNAKVVNLEIGNNGRGARIGILPDSINDSISIYTYAGSLKLESRVKLYQDSAIVAEDSRYILSKRRIGFPKTGIFGGAVLGLGALALLFI